MGWNQSLGGLSPSEQVKLNSLPKNYIGVKSEQTYAISTDNTNATIFNGLVLETANSAIGWQVESALGGVRNTSGKTLEINEGLVSSHTVSTNNSTTTLYIYSETSTDNGVTWIKNDGSGREQTVSGQSKEYGSKSSQAFSVADQAIVRFRAFAGGADVSITTVSFIADGDTVTGPSLRWRLGEV